MKIRYLSLIVLLVMSVFAPMQAQTYDYLWKELEVLERKDLPKSVISEAMKIYDKAKAEQNVPQMMKAYLTAMQYRSLLTPEGRYEWFGTMGFPNRQYGRQSYIVFYSG